MNHERESIECTQADIEEVLEEEKTCKTWNEEYAFCEPYLVQQRDCNDEHVKVSLFARLLALRLEHGHLLFGQIRQRGRVRLDRAEALAVELLNLELLARVVTHERAQG